MAASAASVATTATTTYNTLPDYDAGAVMKNLEIYVSTASVVAFSYDGKNEHGRLDSANLKASSRRFESMTIQKIWLRAVSGGPATVEISTWS